ncbi:MAG: hypothetical protein O7F69_13045, partial [Alphaproteobacteria bacterium]|nr:hypothetical protein [Alphaproteobacteria bacterium]
RTTNPPVEFPQFSVRIAFDPLDNIDEDYVFAFMTPSRVRLFETRSRMRAEKGKPTVVTISSGPAVFSEPGIYKVRFGPVGQDRIVEKLTIKFDPKNP